MSRKYSVLTINAEIRRLQRTMALLVCIQTAAAEDTEADLGDALAVIVALVEDSLQGLDRLEASGDREMPDGHK